MRAIFLDRDGVINEKMPEGQYVLSIEDFKFKNHIFEGLRELGKNALLIVITNQRCVARKFITESVLRLIHKHMLSTLRKQGIEIDAVYYCPHEKNECKCRKPDVGMLDMACIDFPNIDINESYFIGDSLTDIIAADKFGCKSVLIQSDETENILNQLFEEGMNPTIICESINNASQIILSNDK